jgi:hypothetical protein
MRGRVPPGSPFAPDRDGGRGRVPFRGPGRGPALLRSALSRDALLHPDPGRGRQDLAPRGRSQPARGVRARHRREGHRSRGGQLRHRRLPARTGRGRRHPDRSPMGGIPGHRRPFRPARVLVHSHLRRRGRSDRILRDLLPAPRPSHRSGSRNHPVRHPYRRHRDGRLPRGARAPPGFRAHLRRLRGPGPGLALHLREPQGGLPSRPPRRRSDRQAYLDRIPGGTGAEIPPGLREGHGRADPPVPRGILSALRGLVREPHLSFPARTDHLLLRPKSSTPSASWPAGWPTISTTN